MTHGGFATPILVESHMGRPTKVEPNPEHPATKGGTDVFARGSILDLYDPDRSQTIKFRGEIRPWTDFATTMLGAMNSQRAFNGAGFRLVTETITSPSLGAQITALMQTFPAAKWIQYDAVSRDAVRAGAQSRARPRRRNPLQARSGRRRAVARRGPARTGTGPPALRARLRRSPPPRPAATPRRTGLRDRKPRRRTPARWPITASRSAPRTSTASRARLPRASVSRASRRARFRRTCRDTWIAALVKDLQAHRGKSLVVAGEHQPASVHALAHLMNAALGNVGTTVEYSEPVEARPIDQLAALRELVGEMNAGKVDMLVILSANPVFTAPVDLKFKEAMSKVTLRAHLGAFDDETAEQCHWHLPESHYLEQWGDARAFDGTVTIAQPLIAPLYETKSANEVVAALAGQGQATNAALVKTFWEGQFNAEVGRLWRDERAGRPGVRVVRQVLASGAARRLPRGLGAAGHHRGACRRGARGALLPALADAIEVTFSADATVYDGRFANNGWLQETPKPFNKITWDNAALVSPATAERLGLSQQGRHRGEGGRPLAARAGLGDARTARQLGQPAVRLRPHALRPGRQQHRLQRVRAADRRSAVDDAPAPK